MCFSCAFINLANAKSLPRSAQSIGKHHPLTCVSPFLDLTATSPTAKQRHVASLLRLTFFSLSVTFAEKQSSETRPCSRFRSCPWRCLCWPAFSGVWMRTASATRNARLLRMSALRTSSQSAKEFRSLVPPSVIAVLRPTRTNVIRSRVRVRLLLGIRPSPLLGTRRRHPLRRTRPSPVYLRDRPRHRRPPRFLVTP